MSIKFTYDESKRKIIITGIDRVGYEKNMNDDLKINKKK